MKRVCVAAIAAAILTAVLTILSGCSIQVGMNTTVERDGSGTVALRLAADQELQTALAGAVAAGGLGDLGSILGGVKENIPDSVEGLFQLILGNIPTDWKVDRGTDDEGAQWMSVSRGFADLEELKRLLTDSVLSSFVDAGKFHLTQNKGFFCTKTVFSSSADMGKAVEQSAAGEASIPEELIGKVLTVENRLTLPGIIKDNNADEVTRNTLVWQLGVSGGKDMYAESIMYNWGAIIGIAVAALVVLALLIALLVLLLRRRSRRRHEGRPRGGRHARRSRAASDAETAEQIPAQAAAAPAPAPVALPETPAPAMPPGAPGPQPGPDQLSGGTET